MTKTIDKVKLISFYSGKTDFTEVPGSFVQFRVNMNSYEASDEEILELSEQLGMYSFLEDESEDIYSSSDGSPID